MQSLSFKAKTVAIDPWEGVEHSYSISLDTVLRFGSECTRMEHGASESFLGDDWAPEELIPVYGPPAESNADGN